MRSLRFNHDSRHQQVGAGHFVPDPAGIYLPGDRLVPRKRRIDRRIDAVIELLRQRGIDILQPTDDDFD